jgi:hypothetical protein
VLTRPHTRRFHRVQYLPCREPFKTGTENCGAHPRKLCDSSRTELRQWGTAAGLRTVLISLAAMATAASPRLLVSPAATDRKFYTGMAIVMLFTALFGFSRTYFLGLISGHPTTITGRVPNATVHLHALLFMSWLVLFIVQTSLVATHRVKVHRKLGYFGVALAAAMIVVGGRTAVEAARLGAVPPGAKPWNFIAIPFGDITSFAIFFLGAVLWRNNKDKHKRLMILATASLMSAALVRWPGVLAVGPLLAYGLTLLFPIAGAVYDRWSRGRVHPVYWWGLAVMVLGVAVRVALLNSTAWSHATQSLFG